MRIVQYNLSNCHDRLLILNSLLGARMFNKCLKFPTDIMLEEMLLIKVQLMEIRSGAAQVRTAGGEGDLVPDNFRLDEFWHCFITY